MDLFLRTTIVFFGLMALVSVHATEIDPTVESPSAETAEKTSEQGDSEKDCAGQVHCGCCFSVLEAYKPIQNTWPVLEETFQLDLIWRRSNMKPRNFSGKIFRPPIC